MSGENGKRRAERLPGRFKVEVREKLATWVTSTEDVCSRGCRVELRRPLVPGMLVQLAFDMGPEQEPLVVPAQVAWVRRSPPESAGFAFLSMPREAKHPQPGFWIDRVLGAYVRSLSDKASPSTANAPQAQRAAGSGRGGDAIILPPVA